MPLPDRPALAFLVLALLAPAAAAPAEAAPDLEESAKDLEYLGDLLDDRKAAANEVVAYMDVAFKAAVASEAPPAAAESATGEEKAQAASERRAFEERLADLRDDVVDLFIEALSEHRIDRDEENRFEPVNVHAAELLGKSVAWMKLDAKDTRRLGKRIRRAITRRTKERFESGEAYYSAAFESLARLGDMDSLEWMADEYIHTRKTQGEIVRLRAAHRAMAMFQDVPGEIRFAIVEELIRRYSGVEALAEKSTTDTSAIAARRLWNQICTVTIPLVQRLAGEPRDATGVALATMKEFQAWFRDHRNVRAAPWVDAA